MGGTFTDTETPGSKLRRIYISCGDVVDSIQCEYANGQKGEKHGGNSGAQFIFSLDDDESITTIYVRQGKNVDSIQFQTSKGRFSQRYGGTGGGPKSFSGTTLEGGRPLIGFKGSLGSFVRDGSKTVCTDIQPLWSPRDTVNARYTVIGSTIGGTSDGGRTQFNTMQEIQGDTFKAAIKEIKIWSAERIDAFQLVFRDDSRTKKYGGNGGGEHTFALKEDEYVTQVDVRSGTRIDKLSFRTNQRVSPEYGGNGGSPGVWEPPRGDVSSDVQMVLIGFTGECAAEVDRLAPIWAADPPIRYSLFIENYGGLQGVQSKPVSVLSGQSEIINNTSEKMTKTITWKWTSTKSSTVTMSATTKLGLGAKYTWAVESKAKAEVPLIGGAEVTGKIGGEISANFEVSGTYTNGETNTKTTEHSESDTVPIPPGSGVRASAMYYEHSANNVPWTGKLVAHYINGSTRSFPINGTCSNVSHSSLQTKYDSFKLPGNK